ncbi:ABC transporter ATP-binding protein [Loigolactobacillus zhaoyuanensis]|uniref:ABC transporter ATP-binding protein n=1 Tax=Loigolactobacillus zhaoyuanensis TaxID=2486017 RepID=UPI000F736DAB|nr:ABC transporter ATP-binding protein [Loigolactobacillus zhaoyuanensis]
MTAAIEIQHLVRSFGKKAVLSDVNLTVQQGEIFALLGENGSGKTTLIRILTSLLAPDAGTVTILGIPLKGNEDQIRQLISLNSQATTVDGDLSGRANLAFIADLRGVKSGKLVIKDLIERFDMVDFIDRKVATYSGGMKRRLDIAMSLIGDAQIIFLDEPTTGVDPKARQDIWRLIQKIRDEGKTIFLTTQYLEEADQHADHIAFLNKGKIVLSGTPTEIKTSANPQSVLTVALEDENGAARVLPEQQFHAGSVVLSDDQVARSLKLLVNNDIKVVSLGPAKNDLETVFFNVAEEEANEVV